ncbi:MAG: bifunctional 5,10-methylenetetrahydrofolate dehydrogenase/5,10-methenyltetrahydrofolate cyclohydrolase [Acholeplasmataceae bacterium]
MILMNGSKIAKERNIGVSKLVEEALKKYSRRPNLAFILIGNNPASESYVKGKTKACELAGFDHVLYRMDEQVEEKEVIELIERLNHDNLVDGMILQLPIPKHLNSDYLIDLISKEKDADGFHVVNQGLLYQRKKSTPPATPKGIMSLLEHYNIPVSGKHAVVVGRSNIVGMPVASLLLAKDATITVCHRATPNLAEHTIKADILVVAVGKANLITKDMVKPGAVVIDVGVNRVNGKLYGDVDFENVKEVASYITPVPKGVGPMTINGLIENTFELYVEHMERQKM